MDHFTDCRRVRVLTVIGDCAREYVALVANTYFLGQNVPRELGYLVLKRGTPKIVSNMGTEYNSKDIVNRAD